MSDQPEHEPAQNRPRYAPPHIPHQAPSTHASPQQPPQYHAPAPIIVSHPYYATPPARPTNGAATVSLVLGIVGIVLGIWTPIPFLGLIAAFISFIPALLGVIFGHVGMRNAQQVGVGRGAAKTGMVLGYTVIGLILMTSLVWAVIAVSSGFDPSAF